MIRSAKIEDSKTLTRISIESKRYWEYPKEYFEIWKNELTISSDYILKNNVFLYENDESIMGYYSLINLHQDTEVSGVVIKKGFWLEHMFIDPPYIGKGIGKKLFSHFRERCNSLGIQQVGILADPNSKGFYEKMGCDYIREYPSTIKDRTTPFLQYNLKSLPIKSIRPAEIPAGRLF